MSGGTRSIAGQETARAESIATAMEPKPTAAIPIMSGVAVTRFAPDASQYGAKSDLIAALLGIASITVSMDGCPVEEMTARYAYALGWARGLAEIALLFEGVRPVYDCPQCERRFTHEPIVSEDESADEAKRRGRTWCSKECLEKYAERTALDRDTVGQ